MLLHGTTNTKNTTNTDYVTASACWRAADMLPSLCIFLESSRFRRSGRNIKNLSTTLARVVTVNE